MYRHHGLGTKLRAIELYEGGASSVTIGRHLEVDQRMIRRWIRAYRQLGEKSFQQQVYTHSSAEFRVEVVRTVEEKCLSCHQVALQYGISESAVYSWVRKARSYGYESLSETKPRGRPPKDMGRPKKTEPQTELEQLREKVARLEAENALLKKVKALVEERDARLHAIGRGPSKN